jgi:phosphoglycolate/pyridoxal phosphate phosphatase family enzyme
MILAGLDGLVCDLDGVVYLADRAIPGAPEALARLRSAGVRVLFATNNSRLTPASYVDKLTGIGVEASERDVLTSAVVTAEVLAQRGLGGARALVIGGEGVSAALVGAGIEVVPGNARDVDLVVVGWDPGFTYAKLKDAALALQRGATLIATNDDAAYPAPGGERWPGAGSIVAAVATAAGVAPEVMGKPHRPFMERAAARLDGARRVAVVGDRPETDLAGAVAMGWPAVLVLSGVTPPEAAGRAEPPPDVVVDDLAALARLVLGAQ